MSVQALVVNAAELLRRPGTDKPLSIELTIAELGVDDERFAADEAVEVALRLESLTDGVVVDGVVSASWSNTCRRCLEATAGRVQSEVHELYQLVLTDPDAFQITGEQIDLTPMVAETLLLDTPQAPLCTPDCAGLCPTCGINRNVAACECQPDPDTSRWAALDALRGTLPDA